MTANQDTNGMAALFEAQKIGDEQQQVQEDGNDYVSFEFEAFLNAH